MMVGLLTLQMGCATTPKKGEPTKEKWTSEEALAIRKVGIFPKSFWPEKGEKTTIRWTQNRKSDTTLEIRKENGELVTKLEKWYSEGGCEASWDGRDALGNLVSSGVYLYSLRSQERSGHEVLHDPSLTSGGEELKVDHFTFDRQKRTLDFILPRAGRVRLRIGLSPFLHLRTLLNWDPMEAGAHTLVWDGLDGSGLIRAIEHPDLSINLAAFALPDNAILVQGSRKEDVSHSVGSSPKYLRSGLYLHASHDRAHCHDISFQVEFPTLEKDERGLPILQGKTLVRVQLEDKDRNFMVNQRFEVGFFVDTVFLFEEEEGQDPFNYEWNTTGLARGEHLLTVNVIGYEDHLGVKTVRVMKKDSQ